MEDFGILSLIPPILTIILAIKTKNVIIDYIPYIRLCITYLQRPDLGRRLNEKSVSLLQETYAEYKSSFDLGIFVADGLSSRAIHNNALSFIETFLPIAKRNSWTCSVNSRSLEVPRRLSRCAGCVPASQLLLRRSKSYARRRPSTPPFGRAGHHRRPSQSASSRLPKWR